MSEAAVTDPGPSASRAMVWAGATMVGSRLLTLVATLILARLLAPADFGVFAVGLLVINYLDRVKDMGVGAGLIYRQEPWDRVARTGLPMVIASSAFLATLTYVSAPGAADFFDDQRTIDVLRGLALVLLIGGIASVPDAKLRREMDFRRRLVPEIVAALVKGGTSVALAVMGVGVMSLVWGQLVGTVVQALLYWALCGWRPRLGWDPVIARALLRYGLPSSLVAVLAVFIENIDYLVIGRVLDTEQLGFYTMAYRLPELSVMAVCIVAGQVFFPAFSRLQHDGPALRDAYLRAVRYITVLTVPIGAALAVLAPEVVLTLYGSTWEESIPVLRLIAVFAIISALSFHAGELYKATGRPGILNTLAIGEIVLLVPLLWVLADGGIVAVAWGMCAGAVVLTVVRLAIAVRIIALRPGALLRTFVPGLVIGLGVAALTWGGTVGLELLAPGLSPVVRLLLLGALTVVGYLALVRLAAPEVLRLALSTVRSMAGRGKEPQVEG